MDTASSVHNWIFLGCGIYYPVAMESALKMKEVTYLHAEGMPAGFLKHGTRSMLQKSGRHALSMEIGHFLHFQSRFHGNWIIDSAP